MNFQTLTIETKDSFRILTINRPEALNALSNAVLTDLQAAISSLREDQTVRGLIVTGSGEKAFVAGADIGEFTSIPDKEAKAFAERGQKLFSQLESLPFCSIAAVNGFALGGGLELALSCDFIIASENAKLGLPEVGLGLIPGYGGTQRIARALGPHLAKRIVLSGEMFSATQMRDFGLIAEVVPQPQLIGRSLEVLKTISQKSPQAVALAKQAIMESFEGNSANGYSTEAKLFHEAFNTENRKEGVTAFLEKRKPQFGPRTAR
jgi:enoyl-CoA hydratase